jgi:hypothetical protein
MVVMLCGVISPEIRLREGKQQIFNPVAVQYGEREEGLNRIRESMTIKCVAGMLRAGFTSPRFLFQLWPDA